MFWEKDYLTHLVLVANFDVDQKTLQILKQLNVLWVLKFKFHVIVVYGNVITLSIRAKLLFDFEENLDDVEHRSHVIIKNNMNFLLNVVFKVFFSFYLHLFEFFFEYLGEEFNL